MSSSRTHSATRLYALACAAVLAGAAPPCAAATVQVSIEVPAGKTKTVRLRHLPRGAVVDVALTASGKLRIALVSATQLKSRKPEALFRAAFERKLSFRVTAPEAGDYFLVLDNRQGAAPVNTTATIRAARGAARPGIKPPAGDGKPGETRAAAPTSPARAPARSARYRRAGCGRQSPPGACARSRRAPRPPARR